MKKLHQLTLSSLTFLLIFIGSTSAQTFNGYALYNLLNGNTAYLIDDNGNIAHSWSCSLSGSYTVLLKDDGNIVRTGVNSGNQFNGGAVSGIVQELDQNANVVWEFVYSDADHCSHHDITLLPNGNVILIAWEAKSAAELTQAGYDGASSDKWPTHLVEVQQNGSGGQVVWEWHIWDHMVQDFNASKDNYGVVASNPQLMDINANIGGGGPPGPGGGDWYHSNGIDYNATLDQIVFSAHNSSEFYIIDHSTTTAEAASHSGGNAGMGGDFLYRWGNPSIYGSPSPQTIPSAIHDPKWVQAGRPLEGYITFFNNEGISSNQSTVDAVNPPLSGYNYTGFGPTNYDWRHTCLTSNSGQSVGEKMSNGNTFVSVSSQYMYEVDSLDNMLWQYNAGPGKAYRYECDHPGIIALLGTDPCGLTTDIEELDADNINVYPNPSTGTFNIAGIPSNFNSYLINVYDVYGKLVMQSKNDHIINLSTFNNGIYIVHVNVEGEETLVKKVSLIK